MIRKLIAAVVLIPLALVIVLFAVANRGPATLSLDPFSDVPLVSVSLPMFLVVLGALIAGVIVGGMAAWLRQRKWRAAARRLDAEIKALRVETETLKRELEAPPAASIATIAYRHPAA